ncbi:TnsA-like heteromeric transposase endonuclease subunit [Ornithinimicrobium panacihumi]
MREFSWRPKQDNYPGWLWTATTGSLVGYESLLERDRVLLADFDAVVGGIASQPFWLSGDDEGVRRRHVPDYLLTCRDGSVIVVDVKPARMCQAAPAGVSTGSSPRGSDVATARGRPAR